MAYKPIPWQTIADKRLKEGLGEDGRYYFQDAHLCTETRPPSVH